MKVLFVQENPFLSTALKMSLLQKGYHLVFSNYSTQPMSVLDAIQPDLLITDITDQRGVCFIVEAKKKTIPVIAISANGKEEDLHKAFELGADDYLTLPIAMMELVLRVNILSKAKIKAA